MNPQPLPIALLRRDGGTQPRGELCHDTIEQYAEHLAGGGNLPDVDVFHDGENYWLASGFHREAAHRKAGMELIGCLIHAGTLRDAVLFSCAANKEHDSAGRRRSSADKRRAVDRMLRDDEWGKWSNCAIAQHVGVSEGLVRKVLGESTSYIRSQERTGQDGRTINTTSIGRSRPDKPCPPAGHTVSAPTTEAEVHALQEAFPTEGTEQTLMLPAPALSFEQCVVGLMDQLNQMQVEQPDLNAEEGIALAQALLEWKKRFRCWTMGQKYTPPKQEQPEPTGIAIPVSLDTPEFRELWQDWQEHRKEKGGASKKKLTSRSLKQSMNRMEKMGLPRALKALEYSIAQGWDGVYEEQAQEQPYGKPHKATESRQEQFDRIEKQMGVKL